MSENETTVVIVDDHVLMGQALSSLIASINGYAVLYDVPGGAELIRNLQTQPRPDIVLLDVNMPFMDGYEVASWLKNNCSDIKVIALSMNDSDDAILRMLQNGVRGYLLKGCKSAELKLALDSVSQFDFYYSGLVAKQLNKVVSPNNNSNGITYSLREIAFIKLACSDLTYAEIAEKMCVSPRTVDGYREVVFQKMTVKSRVGMVLEALRSKLIEL